MKEKFIINENKNHWNRCHFCQPEKRVSLFRLNKILKVESKENCWNLLLARYVFNITPRKTNLKVKLTSRFHGAKNAHLKLHYKSQCNLTPT